MKRMTIVILPLLAPFAGCGDNTNTDGAVTHDMTVVHDLTMLPDMTATGDMVMPPPAPPSLGAQIDRMGRPAVNTALTDPFDTVANMTTDMVKDVYNQSSDPTTWGAKFLGDGPTHQFITGNLAIFDGLDAKCGNQALAMANGYATLGSVLANDQLFVDTSQSTCGLYLGVEAHAVLGTPADCGGRTPLEDTIDETYTLLAVGPSGICQPGPGCPNGFVVTDGVDKDADGNPMNSGFPFLGNPN